MQVGMFGQKGHVHYQMSNCINDELGQINHNLPKAELSNIVAAIIDKHIHRNYRLFPSNYIAHDLMTGTNEYSNKYSAEEKDRFVNYLQGQIDKIELPDKDIPFLQSKLLLMYANPLTNYEAANK
jgi:hypothetical protein